MVTKVEMDEFIKYSNEFADDKIKQEKLTELRKNVNKELQYLKMKKERLDELFIKIHAVTKSGKIN